MLIALTVILVLAWIVGFTVYHVASFALHMLLLAAVVSLVLHFFRGRNRVLRCGPTGWHGQAQAGKT